VAYLHQIIKKLLLYFDVKEDTHYLSFGLSSSEIHITLMQRYDKNNSITSNHICTFCVLGSTAHAPGRDVTVGNEKIIFAVLYREKSVHLSH